jgi:hypothetical protein
MPMIGCCLPVVTHFPLRNAAAALLVIALWPSVSPAAAASPVAVDIERRDDTYFIAASAALRTDAATAWRILTSYSDYPRFIPGIRSSHVVSRHGHVVTVEQSDDSLLWPMHWPLHVVYEITELPPDRIESRAVAQLMPMLQSKYTLTATGSGVRLDYSGRVHAGFAGLGDIEEWALRRSVNRQFQALADEIDRNATDAADPRPAPNQDLLDR